MRKLLTTAAAVLAVAISFAQVDPNRVVAVVNGEEIKGAEYYRRMEFLPSNLASSQQGLNNVPAGFLTLKQLITERLVFQIARAKGVTPTEPEVDAEYKANLAADPKLLQQWKADGRTEAELREQVRYELAQFKVRTSGITITDQEIEQHYKQNLAEFKVPKSYKLRVIVVGDPAEQKAVDAALAAGQAFSEVARAKSVDATRVVGGDFGIATEQTIAPAFRTAITATPAGKTTAWLPGAGDETKGVFIKFLVESIEPAKTLPLTPELKRNLRKRLMIDKGDVRNNVAKELAQATLNAKIDIRQPLFARLYQQMVGQFARAQKD